MKLRIRGNSLRLRLSRAEVNQLKHDGLVAESIRFSPNRALHYLLSTRSEAQRIEATYDSDTITVRVPRGVVAEWADDSDQVGIQACIESDTAEGGELRILIEKDFACQSRSSETGLRSNGEDDSDAFPNPKAGLGAC